MSGSKKKSKPVGELIRDPDPEVFPEEVTRRCAEAVRHCNEAYLALKELSTICPSRELSLAITNVEQGQMWLVKHSAEM